MKKERVVRRRRIPAFGEWNYDHDDGEGYGYGYGYGYGGGDWPVTQYFDSAMQAGLVIALPPAASPKPAKKAVKWIDSGALEAVDDEKKRQHKVVVGLAVAAAEEHGARRKQQQQQQGKQRGRVADAWAHSVRPPVVKAVDQDLYEIPPDMLCHYPRQKRVTRRRSLWTGCLGLSCVAA